MIIFRLSNILPSHIWPENSKGIEYLPQTPIPLSLQPNVKDLRYFKL